VRPERLISRGGVERDYRVGPRTYIHMKDNYVSFTLEQGGNGKKRTGPDELDSVEEGRSHRTQRSQVSGGKLGRGGKTPIALIWGLF